MTIGRDVFHAHPDDWSSDQWRQAIDYIALAIIENEELNRGEYR